jgi:integrase
MTRLLTTLFAFALDRELIEHPIAYRLKRPAPLKSRDRVLTDAELEALWRQLNLEPRRRAVPFKLALLTGARIGEIFGMRWGEIDFDRGIWNLPAERTKTAAARPLPLVPTALELLRGLHHDGADPAALVIAPGRNGCRDPRGNPVALRQRWLKEIRERAGLGDRYFHSHDLRRTVATKLAELGTPQLTIQKILGHRVPGTIAVYDRHGYLPEMRAALERWERRLKAIVAGRGHIHTVGSGIG